ncbi:MAG: RNA polymerase sigma-70 factor (ECF subfamily) [Cellvibrionaceae bacterium]|jgi:RNA polymerase sigma-70 factor (ECF subfamily)
MDEPYLIGEAKKGDVQAYNTLVLHYQDLAYSVAYRIMGDGESAADAAQDAFVNAWKKIHSFKEGNFKAWLMRIVTNRCYDLLKYNKRRPQSSLDEISEVNESSKWLQSTGDRPDDEHDQAEMFEAIQNCLNNLPDDQRIIAVLCDVEGYDYQDAADMAACSLGTVKSRLNRARNKLRDCLRGLGELLPDKYR